MIEPGASFTTQLVAEDATRTPVDEYEYDEIGNLVADNTRQTEIAWTVYGKVKKVTHTGNGQEVTFAYDGAGNRVSKSVTSSGITATTHYLRDASGNVMAIYKDTQLAEQPIYGSSRLGQYNGRPEPGKRIWQRKMYELSNHLGNVLAVVGDGYTTSAGDKEAWISSLQDYYPFGLAMEGRSSNIAEYRYGFNGKERDPATEWGQTSYDYGFRIYNPEVGKFLSVDPLTKSYPMLTPFQFASNTPIQAIDLDGLEAEAVINEAEKYLGTLYEWAGKNPHADLIGIQNNPDKREYVIEIKHHIDLIEELSPSYQSRVLFRQVEKALGWDKFDISEHVGYASEAHYEYNKLMIYKKLGLENYYEDGYSLGLDCSGLVTLAYKKDLQLEEGFTIHSGSEFMGSQKFDKSTVLSETGKLAAIIHHNPNYISKADIVHQTGHVMLATGKVRRDESGNVNEFQVIHQAGGKGGTYDWINVAEANFRYIHPMRKSDPGQGETNQIRFELTVKENQWTEEKQD